MRPTKLPLRHVLRFRIYTIGLTVIVLSLLGVFVWYNTSTINCPKPAIVQYSYDDPRDYLGPFLAAVTSHDSRVVRSYYVAHISKTDKQTIQRAMKKYRSMQLSVDGWAENYPWSDVGERSQDRQRFTRLTWTTKKVDGCWRVQRVDEKTLTVGELL